MLQICQRLISCTRMVAILARKYLARALLALGGVSVLVLMAFALNFLFQLFESSAYDVVAAFVLLIIGSNVLAQISVSFLDA